MRKLELCYRKLPFCRAMLFVDTTEGNCKTSNKVVSVVSGSHLLPLQNETVCESIYHTCITTD